MTFIGTEIHKTFSTLFGPGPDDAKQAAKDKIAKRLALIEKRLAGGRDYLGGSDFSVADAYLFVMGRWARSFKLDMTDFPNFQAYLDRIAARPKVQAALAAEGLS
ncbi:MAG: hypothetical protein EON96_15045 [Caulobacteraceae bacterium]|nr:MAG: hypothetical protein EON96_15045 [Caulobacteraceae bacterium]